ncbi:MAG: VOC family protein [Labilithrix sp.]|nr:VOC family protein [Labilithrix sp.]
MGNPFVHLDLSTDDPAAAKKFYKSVFDWKFRDFPAMQWTGIDVGKGVGGGLGGKQMPSQPTAWTAYVDVADVKKTIAKAKSAGATIIVPFQQVGDMGCLGVFIDPQGATIGVWQAAKKSAAPAKRAKKSAAPAKKPAAKAKKKAAAKKKR